MVKPVKIDDVKRPDKVLPSATSRPILVVDQSTTPAGDPMLAPADEGGQKTEASDELSVLSHTAKTIIPLSAPVLDSKKEELTLSAGDGVPAQAGAKPVLPLAETDTEKHAEPASELESAPEPKTLAASVVAKPKETLAAPKPEQVAQPSAGEGKDTIRDPEAAQNAADIAAAEVKAKRDQELEDIVTSGKYVVPINAVQRRRSHIAALLLCLLALLLAGALLDAIFDVGVVKAPNGVPHTHFFSKL